MDRDGLCVQGCSKFPLAPMTCAFLAMDRRMDRDGSGWIVRSGLIARIVCSPSLVFSSVGLLDRSRFLSYLYFSMNFPLFLH